MAVLDEAATDLRQTLAALQRELDQRTAERDEALAQQAATSEILGVISRSQTDVQPVFEAIVAHAASLCEAEFSAVAQFDDGLLHLIAINNMSPDEKAAFHSLFPRPPTRGFAMGRALLDAGTVHFADVLAEPGYDPRTLEGLQSVARYRSFLGVPIFRDGRPIGVIGCGRREVKPFTATQIELVKTFADQAAIAVENVRLLNALETRNRDVQEALEQQTATAEVLQVINSSPGDLAPVFKEMLEKATRLCEAPSGIFWTFDGEFSRAAALHGIPDAFAEYLRKPIRLDPVTGLGRVRQGEQVAVSVDLAAEEPYRAGNPQRRAFVDLGQARSAVRVPLVKDSRLLGIFTVYRQEVRPFTDKQIALLQNFAAQAVIAMENARLINETREALEQQTATAEVLQVINSSPGDLAPVFQAMVERAVRLCEADEAALRTFDGQFLHLVAAHGEPDVFEQLSLLGPSSLGPTSLYQPLVRGDRVLHVPDVRETPAYTNNRAAHRRLELRGVRTWLAVALHKDGALLGVINVHRHVVRPFSLKQIALLQNFAAQAVIAMENARLITETREALEQQTATAEVLQVINSSPGDLTPVFDAMLEKAMRLCVAAFGILLTFDGGMLRSVAFRNLPEGLADYLGGAPFTPDPDTTLGSVVRERRTIHTLDNAEAEPYRKRAPLAVAAVELGKTRTVLHVPLLREGAVLGVFIIFRQEVRPFSDKQIALLENFADQAVIAIENARLITETREALEQQTATAEVLQVINSSPGDLAPVFEAMLDKAMHLCGAAFGMMVGYDGEQFPTIAIRDLPPAAADFLQRPLATEGSLAELVHGENLIHIPDARETETYRLGVPARRALVDLAGARTALWVALRKEQTLLGAFVIYRQEVRPFSEKQIALLQNFAAQAVIAMENARLLTETREALEQQTATADILRVISSSPTDVQPTFEAIASAASTLCGAANACVFRFDGSLIHFVAHYGLTAAQVAATHHVFPIPSGRASITARAILSRQIAHVADFLADPEFGHPDLSQGGLNTTLSVPMLHDGEPIGAITLVRQEKELFSEKQINLLKTFADQAVIAIENVRLFNELNERTRDLQESLEYQTATSDVLKVISRSTFDLDAALSTVVTAAARLCRADHAGVYRNEGGEYRWAAGYNQSPEYESVERAVRILPAPGTLVGRTAVKGGPVQILDAETDPFYEAKEDARIGNIHSMLGVPLLREGSPIGVIGLARTRIEPFTGKQVELVSTFADQSVIAIENARLLNELQARTDELTRSVAELQALEEVLRAVNSSLDLDTVLATIISRAAQLSQADEGTIYEFDEAEEVFAPKSAFGMSVERVEALRERKVRLGETHLGRAAVQRAPVHVEDVQRDPTLRDPDRDELLKGIHAVLAVPLLRDDKVVGGLVIRRRTVGGFAPTIPTLLQTFAGQAVLAIENARLFQELGQRGEEARRAHAAAEAALADLRRAQDRLVQSEKMASLGQLTAGIAHEIKNPLNFVNNFAGLSVELLEELKETAAPAIAGLAEDERADVDEIVAMLTGNLEKIAEHGRRADGIVKSMLEHSRGGSGERREVDLNSLVEEALNLAYHGARAQDQQFNITLERDLDRTLAPVELVPQDMTRVFLNLFGNGFYAAAKRRRGGAEPDFRPALKVATHDLGEAVEIRIRDNGTGIPPEIRDRLFQPFFTTKPTGEGTGLGLSISWDIVTQQHGGTIAVDSRVGEFTEFTIRLPRSRQAVTAVNSTKTRAAGK